MSDTERKDALLLAVLNQVPFDGWTEKALLAADPDQACRMLFPDGMRDIVDHFADWADRRMEAGLKPSPMTALAGLRVRDRITLLVRTRLEELQPYKEAVRREGAFLALKAPDLGPRLVWRTANRIWYLAGDTATDFNHYTKRALLSGVIVSTTLAWLGDKSPEHQETWAFLDRRIENVMSAGKMIGQAKKFADPSALMEKMAAFAAKARFRQ